IGVYPPSLTMFMDSGEANKGVLALAQKLLESQHDFDFIDDSALNSALTLQKGSLRSLSGSEYRTILVPAASVVSKAALARLQAFAGPAEKSCFSAGFHRW
ncbi:MAG: hypothetical protein M1436_01375, partial [Acidobacteria bacterium]|nr:hypothetical protein [Acidobacteriota bacterium]